MLTLWYTLNEACYRKSEGISMGDLLGIMNTTTLGFPKVQVEAPVITKDLSPMSNASSVHIRLMVKS